MVIRVVQLGTARAPDEGTRIGTVRRPPRGVPKADYAKHDWFDTWLPELAPSPEAVKQAQDAQTDAEWQRFCTRYRREMATPQAGHLLALLATLSQQANLSVGCYCDDESRCHRVVLRELLVAHGAKLAA